MQQISDGVLKAPNDSNVPKVVRKPCGAKNANQKEDAP